jgi:hypothetical protein
MMLAEIERRVVERLQQCARDQVRLSLMT